jgi:hypothetical protein
LLIGSGSGSGSDSGFGSGSGYGYGYGYGYGCDYAWLVILLFMVGDLVTYLGKITSHFQRACVSSHSGVVEPVTHTIGPDAKQRQSSVKGFPTRRFQWKSEPPCIPSSRASALRS